MSVRMVTRMREPREVIVKLVDGSVIKGKINLYHDESCWLRVSDLLNKVSDQFVAVYEAATDDQATGVFLVNKMSILWVSPQE